MSNLTFNSLIQILKAIERDHPCKLSELVKGRNEKTEVLGSEYEVEVVGSEYDGEDVKIGL